MDDSLPKKIGPYEILDTLGKGGMSTVYKALQPSLNREVALKVLPLQLAREEELVERFERESSIVAALTHPNIIQIIDRGTDQGLYYIVMEYVEGRSLDKILLQPRMPMYQLVGIALQIAQGLAYAHGKGVVHRDIKPTNILLAEDSQTVKVTDFGIAKIAEAELAGQTLTREHAAIGTLEYMSPEQRRGSRQVDARSDIYSFGVLLFEMVAGRVPMGRFRDLHEYRDDTPPLLNKIVLRCLQEDPSERYPSFEEVVVDLQKLSEKEMVYREMFARVSDRVRKAPRKAGAVLSERLSDVDWRGRLSRVAQPVRRLPLRRRSGEPPEEGAGPAGAARRAWALRAAVLLGAVALLLGAILLVSRGLNPYRSRFALAEDLREEGKFTEALETLRDVRKEASGAGHERWAAEAQWRIAKIHEERGHTRSAGIAYAYLIDTYGEQEGLVGDERMQEALFRAAVLKAEQGAFAKAAAYLARLREAYPDNPNAEAALYREIILLADQIDAPYENPRGHTEKTLALCRAFLERYPESAKREEVLFRVIQQYLNLGGGENRKKAVEAADELRRDFPHSRYLPLYGL